MRLTFQSDRILAIVAHPDDVELLCAGTLARATSDGAAVGWVICCRGDKGVPDPPPSDPVAVRCTEAQRAAQILNATVYFGNIPDGELDDSPAIRQMLTEYIRRFRPTLILRHADNDYHPDHRAASAAAFAASWFAASRGQVTESEPLAEPPAVWNMDTVEGLDFRPDFYIDIAPHLDVKRRMLQCHASQLARATDRDFACLEALMLRQAAARGAEAGTSAAEAFAATRAWKRQRAL